ncbi:hypothetical protein ACHAWF_015086 [Thalassiosira exigua]
MFRREGAKIGKASSLGFASGSSLKPKSSLMTDASNFAANLRLRLRWGERRGERRGRRGRVMYGLIGTFLGLARGGSVRGRLEAVASSSRSSSESKNERGTGAGVCPSTPLEAVSLRTVMLPPFGTGTAPLRTVSPSAGAEDVAMVQILVEGGRCCGEGMSIWYQNGSRFTRTEHSARSRSLSSESYPSTVSQFLPSGPEPKRNGVPLDTPFETSLSSFDIMIVDAPTHNDVLLGRGVATNRHRGNENFRSIVSEHVSVYVTSKKKQKMIISKSIVDYVKTELAPPGRFLAKDPATGSWYEVEERRALEKTAQALRDGGAPMRKQLREDVSDPDLLDALFDRFGSAEKSAAAATTPSSGSSEAEEPRKKHRRVISSSSAEGMGSDARPPAKKMQRPAHDAARREHLPPQRARAPSPGDESSMCDDRRSCDGSCSPGPRDDRRSYDGSCPPGVDTRDSLLDELKPFVRRGSEEEGVCRRSSIPSPSDGVCYGSRYAEYRFSDGDWDRFASLLMRADI